MTSLQKYSVIWQEFFFFCISDSFIQFLLQTKSELQTSLMNVERMHGSVGLSPAGVPGDLPVMQ